MDTTSNKIFAHFARLDVLKIRRNELFAAIDKRIDLLQHITSNYTAGNIKNQIRMINRQIDYIERMAWAQFK